MNCNIILLHIIILTSFSKFYGICYFSSSKDSNTLSKQVQHDHLVFEKYSEKLINNCFFEQTILREQEIVAVALLAKFQKPNKCKFLKWHKMSEYSAHA